MLEVSVLQPLYIFASGNREKYFANWLTANQRKANLDAFCCENQCYELANAMSAATKEG